MTKNEQCASCKILFNADGPLSRQSHRNPELCVDCARREENQQSEIEQARLEASENTKVSKAKYEIFSREFKIDKFAADLIRERRERGLSQRRLARAIKVTDATIWNIENKKIKRPRQHTLNSLCRLLGLDSWGYL